MTGLLPREARQVNYSPCALRFHDCMEDGLPIHWQQNQKEGRVWDVFDCKKYAFKHVNQP